VVGRFGLGSFDEGLKEETRIGAASSRHTSIAYYQRSMND